jgi:hypothetical protein
VTSDFVDLYGVSNRRQSDDHPLTMTQGLRSVITSGPGSLILLAVVVVTIAVLIVVVQGALGDLWSTVIEIVAIIAGASAIRLLARRHRQNQPE